MGYYRAGKFWNNETLWKYAEDKEVIDVDTAILSKANFGGWNSQTIADAVKEIKTILSVDTSYPIIITPNFQIVDGCHRLIKVMVDGGTSIKAVIIDINADDFPEPDYDEWKAVQGVNNLLSRKKGETE